MECFEQAATMADLLVIVYRHRLKENPTTGGKVEHGAPRSAPYSGTPTPARSAGNLPVEFTLRAP
ncbi:hypothetical protein A4X09_0g7870, partial [Tilletia walkeri]